MATGQTRGCSSSHVASSSDIFSLPARPVTTIAATTASTIMTSSGKKNKRKSSQLDEARWPSVLFLSWLDHLLWQGTQKPQEDEDIPAVPSAHALRVVRNRITAFQRTHPRTSFGAVIFRTFIWRWMSGFVGQCIFVGSFSVTLEYW